LRSRSQIYFFFLLPFVERRLALLPSALGSNSISTSAAASESDAPSDWSRPAL